MPMLTDLPTGFVTLDADEERRLIAVAQDVPSHVEDGRTVYRPTPQAHEAMERLTAAYFGFIQAIARKAVRMDADDALALAATEFVQSVRDFDLTAPEGRLFHYAPAMMRNAINDAQQDAAVVTVSRRHARRYYAHLAKHEGDVVAAYQTCREADLAPETFLALHRALGPVESLDVSITGATNRNSIEPTSSPVSAWAANQVADPVLPEDEVVDSMYVAWLFTKVDDVEATALRLAYGFVEADPLRLEAGYRMGEILSDDQVGSIIGKGRATTQRLRTKALAKMRAAALDALADEA